MIVNMSKSENKIDMFITYVEKDMKNRHVVSTRGTSQ